MNEFEELARRVERHWGEESRIALAYDEERLRKLVDAAMASSRACAGAPSALSTWMKGIGLCAVAVAGSVGVAVYDGGHGVDGGHGAVEEVARVDEPPPVLAPEAPAALAPEAPVEVSNHVEAPTTAATDLPSAEPPRIETRASPTVRPRAAPAHVARVEADVASTAMALSPAEIFARANEERRRSDLRAAEADYRLLMDQAPSSREALLSHVILGHVLEEREPAAALSLFERYLELGGGGGLAEEARTSRARILAMLGRRDDAVRAWRELLARHPDTLHRAEAEAALRSTGAHAE